MDPVYLLWLSVGLLWLVIWTQHGQKKAWMMHYIMKQKGKDLNIMEEAARKLIGKKCYIYLLSGEVQGEILEVTDHAMVVDTGSVRETLNLDFVIRIRELPRKK